jgi:hypothetical protein
MVAIPPMIAYRMPRSSNVVTKASNACRSVDPLGGKESSALLTPLLPIALSGCQCPAAPLAGSFILRRHRAGHVQQLTQRLKALAGGTRLIQRDLTPNAPLKCCGAVCFHPSRSYHAAAR